jgi:adenine deaminase
LHPYRARGRRAETAVYRGVWSAARFRLTDRGLIAPGYVADIVLLGTETCGVHTGLRAGQVADDELFALGSPFRRSGAFRSSIRLLLAVRRSDAGRRGR